MKAIFIHDHFFYQNQEGLVYDSSGGAFGPELWDRYLKQFECLTVIGRKKNEPSNNITLSSRSRVQFKLLENLNNPMDRFLKKKHVYKVLTPVISTVDCVIIRLPSTLGLFAASLCKRKNIPYILEIVGDPFSSYWYHGPLKAKIIAPYEAWKMKMAARSAQSVIYVTKEFLQKKYPSFGLQESISNVRLLKAVNNESIETFYKENSDQFNIGFIGTFHVRYKGQIEALKALRNFLNHSKIENVKLYFVGSGKSTWLQSTISELELESYVEILGTLEAGEKGIIPFLDKLDVFIHPSKTEGLPRVVIEAMSRGKLCLTSDVGGIPELIDPEYIHKSGDWKKLASDFYKIYNLKPFMKIESALRNRDKAKEYLESVLQKKRELFIKKSLGLKSHV